MSDFLDRKIEFLKGVGPARGQLLNSELAVFTFGDLLDYYPFRYEDRTKFHQINSIGDIEGFVQIKGILTDIGISGGGRKQRLVATLSDQTGSVELIWFKGIQWIHKKLKSGVPYLVYGKPSQFNSKFTISHPEIDVLTPANEEGQKAKSLVPVYSSTEKLKRKYLDSKAIAKFTNELIRHAAFEVSETIDSDIVDSLGLMALAEAKKQIHYPDSESRLEASRYRLKFDELFFIQLSLFQKKLINQKGVQGIRMTKTDLVSEYYEKHLPFELTGAQKNVIKEIYGDLSSGLQMNRLLQGDVGSGKTITAFVCILIAISSGYQTAIMAPTEILAQQHAASLAEECQKLGLNLALITGSTTKSKRRKSVEALVAGEIHIVVGTHALIEDDVQFKALGLVVIDEQHRFGVAQRAKLWQKGKGNYPHVLVMTATPIPRTLAMTLYGDLEASVIDELPKGRKPIKTTHLTDKNRLKLFGFLQQQIEQGRQVYIVYPLIEESETLEYKDLMDGYESICRAFPAFQIGILHGRMKSADKDYEMARFLKGETQIMVATTVIEVGVNVPNASVMVIENAERFGLSQLHQLRGRVGRGSDQSYCILMTGDKVSRDARARTRCMVATNDGFRIAEKDLELRGPGNLMGTQQSGLLDLKIANLATDSEILKLARATARAIVEKDPDLSLPEHMTLSTHLNRNQHLVIDWGSVS